MEKREKKKLNMKKQWTKFVLVMVCYLLFLYWVKSWLGLIVIPFIYDAYISKKINWKWWQDLEGPMRAVMSWVDAIVFALGAVLAAEYTKDHSGLLTISDMFNF